MSTLSATPMEAGKPSRRWGRSIGALVAGFLAVLIFSLGTDRAACAQDFSALGHAMAGGFVGAGVGHCRRGGNVEADRARPALVPARSGGYGAAVRLGGGKIRQWEVFRQRSLSLSK